MEDQLTLEERKTLLRMAREAMERGVKGEKLPPLDDASLTPHLREDGASFVTLTVRGQLRGCIGTLEPYQPLADDVREHAVAAALDDPRFPPVSEHELHGIEIEVSRLTRPIALEYKDASDLLSKLRPHVDGVILRDAFRRATFLRGVAFVATCNGDQVFAPLQGIAAIRAADRLAQGFRPFRAGGAR